MSTKREKIDFTLLSKEKEEDHILLIDLLDAAVIFVKENYPKELEGIRDSKTGETKKPSVALAQRLNLKYGGYTITRLLKRDKLTPKYFKNRVIMLEEFEKSFDLNFYKSLPYATGPIKSSPTGLHRIAEKLALNLVDVSSRLRDDMPYSRILKEERLWEGRKEERATSRERLIAIIGAGASNAASSRGNGLPTSATALRNVKAAFNHKLLKEIVRENLEAINSQLGSAEEDDFERNMRALIRISPNRVIASLKEQCGYSDVPSLFYEILAHLLKHRFLDGIVNFNYDELLDKAIEEEMPNNTDYRFIYTAGHCPQSLTEISINNRLRHPIYIKCHGTISHPNSLRFRDADAFTIERAIQAHLKELFKANLPDPEMVREEEMVLNLLVFGFSMKNQVFNSVVEQVYKSKEKQVFIWVFDEDIKLKRKIKQRFEGIRNKVGKTIKVYSINISKHGGMTGTMERLWELVEDCFHDRYRPKGITRHLLVNHVLGDTSPKSLYGKEGETLRKAYHKNRLYLEIAIHLLEANGQLHLSQLSANRIGKNYNLIDKKKPKPIQLYLQDMGLEVYKDFMNDTFMIPDKDIRNDEARLIDFLREKLFDNLSDKASSKVKAGPKRTDLFKKYANSLMRRRLHRVNPKFENVHDNLFSHLTDDHVMNTSLAWIYNYHEAIKDPNDWDLMLAVSEQGRFLKPDLDENLFQGKHFEMILSSFDLEATSGLSLDHLDELSLLSDKPLFRPWWRHNQHMVILMKRKNTPYTGDWRKDWSYHEGYYYTHRMLSRRITPVKVKNKLDGEKLLSLFGVYWAGAETYHLDKNNKADDTMLSMGVVSKRSTVEKVLQHLFDICEERLVR